MLPAAAFARAALQQQLAYRTANWAGVFTNSFFLFFRAYLFEACYAHRDDIGGLSVTAALTWASLTQALLMVAPQWGEVGIAAKVRSGQIAVDLLRPVDLTTQHMATRMGVSAYYVAMRMLPLGLVGGVAGLLAAPASPGAALAFAASVVLAAWIANGILYLVELSSFWLESEGGIRLIVLGLSLLPSGLMLPLSWLPAPLELACRLSPFPYTLAVPTEIWIGSTTGPALATALGIQLAWAVALTAAGRLAVARGTHHLQLHGG